jgi:Cu/Ag efflux protein CusF
MLRHILTAFATAALFGTTAAHAVSPGLMAARLPVPVPAVLLVHGGHGGAAAQATGTVNAVDLAQHKVNLSHGPIKALGWPAMTMDFPVGPDVDLAAVKPGMRVNLTLIRGSSGMVVDSVGPAGSGQ